MATQKEVEAGARVLRIIADDAGYGAFVTDAQLFDWAQAVIEAAEDVQKAEKGRRD